MACDCKSFIRIGKWLPHNFVALWLPGRLRFSNANIRVNIEKVEGTNTSYDPDHRDKQDHLCVRLNIRGNTEVDVEGLNSGLEPGQMDLDLPSILLAHWLAGVGAGVLFNKLDDLCAHINFQQDIRNCNVLCFTQTWLNPWIPCLVFVFSLLRSRRRYRIHQASTERLRKSFYPQTTRIPNEDTA